MTERNDRGEPFSKWQPAEKFLHVWTLETPPGSEPHTEYLFEPARKWRFDFAWPRFKVAVEIQGFGPGGRGGGHQLQARMMNDNEKHNRAAELGWVVLRYDSRWLGSRDRVSEAVMQTLHVICEQNKALAKPVAPTSPTRHTHQRRRPR